MPTKLAFDEVTLDQPGYFSFNESAEVQSDSTDTLDALVASLIEMENLIKKNFMMAPEKLEQFARTNPTQLTLRDQVEELNQQLAELKTKHREMMERFYSKNKDDSNALDQKDAIDKLKTELKVRDALVEQAQKRGANLDVIIAGLKASNKQKDEEISHLKNQYLPKIKDTKKFQNEIYDELERIRQDSALLPSMFRAEAVFRLECKKERDEAVEKMNNAMKQHNKLVSERDDLKNELERK
jgi:chromosome segregation ATPase